MAAYVISEVEMLDETQGRRYRELAAGSIARHGGRYLVRGAAPVVAEGNWPASARIVIVEFPSMERRRAWYASADYAEALAVRQTALDRRASRRRRGTHLTRPRLAGHRGRPCH